MNNKTLAIIIIVLFCILSVMLVTIIGETEKTSEESYALSDISSESDGFSAEESLAPISEEESGKVDVSEESTVFSEEESSEINSVESSSEINPVESSSEEPSEESAVEVISYAIDIEPYLEYIEPEDDSAFTFLVNKNTTPLASDYVPSDLVLVSNPRSGRESQCKMNKTAAKALEAFLKEAAYYGYDDITVTNAYRSYAYQNWLFNDYYFKQEYALHPTETKAELLARVARYSFPPGNSEHQTGLCCDMYNVPVGEQETFGHTAAADWLEENAWRFGFILRYPEGKEDKTGCDYESWHFRFVGRKLAKYLHENNLTLDEYYGILG